MNRRSLFTAAFALATVGTLAQSETADAGRYRFSGGGRVHARVYSPRTSVGVRYSRPYSRPYVSPRYSRGWGVSGRIYVGPRYGYYPRYYYPYPRYYYYYQPVPSYYGASYYPVQPSTPATTAVVAAPVARPELPKFGIGLFAGGASVEGTDGFDNKSSNEIGLLGRFRLTQGLLLEGEIGKMSYEDDLRVDRRIGGSLVYEFGAYNKLAPYVLAGLGVQQAEVDGQFETRQNYGELGVGLRYAASPNFHLLFDVRAGSRATAESDDIGNADAVTRQITPPSERSNDAENYSRARFSAVLYF